jgi:hypothetical protein
MNKRKLRATYRQYLFSYTFEVVAPLSRPQLQPTSWATAYSGTQTATEQLQSVRIRQSSLGGSQ